MNKKCKDDEILNPETNRCVKRTGVIGKKILKEQNKHIDGKILNPDTGRYVKIDGPTGKKILDEMQKNKVRNILKNKVFIDKIKCSSRTPTRTKTRLSHSRKRVRSRSRKSSLKSKSMSRKSSSKSKSMSRKSSSKSKSRKICKDNEIYNEKTGKCVKRDGKIGQKILKEIEEYEYNHPKIYYAGYKVLYRNKPCEIICRNYGRSDVINTYDIVFENGKMKDFIHFDELEFVSR